MKYIDEKFKEVSPQETVENIKKIFKRLEIETTEEWHDSGLDDCWSLTLTAKGGVPYSNGKGVTKELARASAYAEFVERMQLGLSLIKFQDIIENQELTLYRHAPDVKYMSVDELKENGEWMDYIIKEYGGSITRDTIIDFCKLYSCRDDGMIATLPFYSFFEEKYVYLPIDFINKLYGTNGCCAGNTRNEAWVHALSEMMERHAAIKMLASGEPAPTIPPKILKNYPTVMNIVNQIKENGNFDISIMDYSIGNGFPVVSTRIINKENQAYLVDVAADPVFEIALHRTLTELFQGKNIKNFISNHNSRILNKISDFPVLNNVINQLETGSGLYTADYFTEELTCNRKVAMFPDNRNKTNTELLEYMIGLYKELNKPLYIRNFSFLGFHSYRFVVPGFSESKPMVLENSFSEHLASQTSVLLKDITKANDIELNLFLNHSKLTATFFSRYHNFARLSGIPIKNDSGLLIAITRAYAAYRVKLFNEALKHLDTALKNKNINESDTKYLRCVSKYIDLMSSGISPDKIKIILYKFFEKEFADRLYEALDNGATPFDSYLLKCDRINCKECKFKDNCSYDECKKLIQNLGKEYKKFTDGQNKEIFKI